MIIRSSNLKKGLPKTTESICPECKRIIPAEIFEHEGKVLLVKECREHGRFEDVYWSDAELYLKAEKFAWDGIGVSNPKIKAARACPWECGLCDLHLSHTCLANIDLTNRCNLSCPICFAYAGAAGYMYEPSYEQVAAMLRLLRSTQPVPCPSVQFSGGEPTIHPKFFEIIARAKQQGFAQVQVATNGLKLVEPEFCQQMRAHGMSTVYLQFDGLRDEIYEQARGRKLLDVKLKAIDNCRAVKPKPLSTVLVPTIVNGINDDQVGEIVMFGARNSDVIRSVNFQPVSFTGRIDSEKKKEQRYTLTDLIHGLEEQTEFLCKDDFYPVPVVTPISELISILANEPKVAFTAHPHCGVATFVFVHEHEIIPITRFVDVEGMFARMMELAEKAGKHKFLLRIARKFRGKDLKRSFNKYFGEFIDEKKAPADIDLLDLLSELFSHHTKKSLGKFTWKAMMIGGMHFQDAYNYDLERVKRCVIHYATPDNRIIPFCAYNGGPTYREEIEHKFSVPLEEWKNEHSGNS